MDLLIGMDRPPAAPDGTAFAVILSMNKAAGEGKASLSAQVGRLLEQSRRDQEHRQLATKQKMVDIERRLRHVAVVAADWKLRYVIPRLAELGRMFSNSSEISREAACDAVCIVFRPTPELPVEARLSVTLAPDPAAEKIRVTVSVLMVPVHVDFQREAWLDVLLQAPDVEQMERFLDARIVQFVKDYVSVRDPASTYQSERVSVDPVCQMTIPTIDSAASLDYKGHTYHFCVEECRRKFEEDPRRYVKVVERRAL